MVSLSGYCGIMRVFMSDGRNRCILAIHGSDAPFPHLVCGNCCTVRHNPHSIRQLHIHLTPAPHILPVISTTHYRENARQKQDALRCLVFVVAHPLYPSLLICLLPTEQPVEHICHRYHRIFDLCTCISLCSCFYKHRPALHMQTVTICININIP